MSCMSGIAGLTCNNIDIVSPMNGCANFSRKKLIGSLD
jgi:hypothetical protein